MEYFPKDAYADINKARFSQPLCTVLQVALVDLLMSWGIKPAVVVGHSSGEIAAAYCSGSISRETAWAVSYYRGLAVSQACGNQSSSSSMMAVQLSADRLAPYLSPWNYSCAESDRITIACYNSPCNVTVSGPIQGLDVLGSSLEQQGVLFRKLRVEVAYHSSHMTNAAQIYRQYLKSHWQTKVIGASDSGPLFISTVTGTEITSHELQTPDYWVSNLLNPVKFSSAMSRVLSSPVKSNRVENAVIKHLVELGPHSALRSPLRDICKGIGEDIERFYSSVLVRNQDGLITALDCIGKLYCSGYQVELAKINRELGRTKTPQMLTYLSPYPFNHAQNYWLESRLDQSFRFRKGGRHELLGTPVSDWNELEARWNNRLILKGMDFLSDHKVNESSSISSYPH
jgi:acyl transferase domain-containing protein